MLACITSLKKLSGNEALVPHLSSLTLLRELRLVSRIYGGLARALAPELASVSSLQVLDVTRNYMRAEVATALAPHLPSLT